jgi:hypothetical protein
VVIEIVNSIVIGSENENENEVESQVMVVLADKYAETLKNQMSGITAPSAVNDYH